MNRSLASLIVVGAFLGCADTADGPIAPLSSILASASSAPGATVLRVDASGPPNGDGSARAPFQTLDEAVTHANEVGGATILVAAGVYPVASTIRIEVPLFIKGANVMGIDADGLPTGTVTSAETRIVATPTLGSSAMLIVGRTDAGVLHDVTIANLTFEGLASTTLELDLLKTQDFTVRGSIFRGPAAGPAISMSGSSGQVHGNYISGVGCGLCIGGGNAASPAAVDVRGNRIVGNRNGSVLINGSGTDIDEFADHVEATVVGNDLSDNTSAAGTGFGVRLMIILRDLTSLVNTQSTGHIRAVIRGNRLVDNDIGVLLDAGFPFRQVGPVCDPRTYSGTIDLRLQDNTVAGSRRTPALATFTRSSAALTSTQAARWQYLHNSEFTISDRDGTLAGFWYDHPTNDPFIGPCPNDMTGEPLDNHLFYNGVEVATGRNYP